MENNETKLATLQEYVYVYKGFIVILFVDIFEISYNSKFKILNSDFKLEIHLSFYGLNPVDIYLMLFPPPVPLLWASHFLISVWDRDLTLKQTS